MFVLAKYVESGTRVVLIVQLLIRAHLRDLRARGLVHSLALGHVWVYRVNVLGSVAPVEVVAEATTDSEGDNDRDDNRNCAAVTWFLRRLLHSVDADN